MKVSILIPTYNRADLLKKCLQSCTDQTLPPYEILIGDDSSQPLDSDFFSEFDSGNPIKIRYLPNNPALGQGLNVDRLIREASGTHICLIHDDDLLQKNALEDLSKPFENNRLDASYGKQYIIDEKGVIDKKSSSTLNEDYYRSDIYEGLQNDPVISTVVSQFPNNGYLIDAELAKTTGYAKALSLFQDACDYGFGVLLAENKPDLRLYFVNEYTACYRLSKNSVARNNKANNAAFNSFTYVLDLDQKIHSDPRVKKWLKTTAPAAIGNAINLHKGLTALKWCFSKYHLSYIRTPGGLKRFCLSLSVILGNIFLRNTGKS
ncbi:MAG: glycosyltransferase [Opitutales bacterium]|nr:glycosyltransferase [Opitutales bacterium]